jgi:mono/diheme cytochrome c family protein
MKTKKQSKQRHTSLFSAGLTALMLFGLSPALKGQDAKTNSPAKDSVRSAEQATAAAANKKQIGSTNSASADAAVKPAKPAAKQLTGAELYSMHCARCHPERYPNERTSAQWKTIGMHMRVRANLPADHFRKLLKYLQDNSGY